MGRRIKPHKQIVTERRQRHLAVLRDYKLARGCMDCGFCRHHSALDFDHRPGEVKAFTIAGNPGYSLKRLMAEVAKCDVVCANCHRIRTWDRARTC